MTAQEIIEGNKKITKTLNWEWPPKVAKWMQDLCYADKSFRSTFEKGQRRYKTWAKGYFFYDDELLFHEDWNWIMEAISQIEKSDAAIKIEIVPTDISQTYKNLVAAIS